MHIPGILNSCMMFFSHYVFLDIFNISSFNSFIKASVDNRNKSLGPSSTSFYNISNFYNYQSTLNPLQDFSKVMEMRCQCEIGSYLVERLISHRDMCMPTLHSVSFSYV